MLCALLSVSKSITAHQRGDLCKWKFVSKTDHRSIVKRRAIFLKTLFYFSVRYINDSSNSQKVPLSEDGAHCEEDHRNRNYTKQLAKDSHTASWQETKSNHVKSNVDNTRQCSQQNNGGGKETTSVGTA
jgi:hypothetical protein